MLRPLWVRLLLIVLTLGWASFEWFLGNSTWAALFGGVGLCLVYVLLITYTPTNEAPEKTDA